LKSDEEKAIFRTPVNKFSSKKLSRCEEKIKYKKLREAIIFLIFINAKFLDL